MGTLCKTLACPPVMIIKSEDGTGIATVRRNEVETPIGRLTDSYSTFYHVNGRSMGFHVTTDEPLAADVASTLQTKIDGWSMVSA